VTIAIELVNFLLSLWFFFLLLWPAVLIVVTHSYMKRIKGLEKQLGQLQRENDILFERIESIKTLLVNFMENER